MTTPHEITFGPSDASRRTFLKAVLGTAAFAHPSVRTLFGDARERRLTAPKTRTLVVVELTGGNDGLSTIIPHADDAYRKARSKTRHESSAVLKIDDAEGFHPALRGTAKLFENGQLAIVRSVSYPKPIRSHFESMDIWQTASLQPKTGMPGWLGRWADGDGSPDAESTRVVAIGNAPPRALAGARTRPTSFANPNAYRFVARSADAARYDEATRTTANTAESNLEYLRTIADRAISSSERVRRAIGGYRTRVQYPDTRIASDLAYAAALIAADVGTRVITVTFGGFDTHVDQKGRHDRLMRDLDGALAAFQADLQSNGRADRVVTMVFSEFGRRVAENGSAGTDHGAAAPLLLFGSSLKGGFYGERPSLTDLHDGDIKGQTDFRAVYATLIEKWLGGDVDRVLGEHFEPVKVFGA